MTINVSLKGIRKSLHVYKEVYMYTRKSLHVYRPQNLIPADVSKNALSVYRQNDCLKFHVIKACKFSSATNTVVNL